jgi:hypothetical protein
MSLAEKIGQMVPRELPPDDLDEVRERWEMGLELVTLQEDAAFAANGDGWQTRVVLRDDRGDYHCHRYSCWVYARRWEVWRDYIGSDPVVAMKWLCGESV